jgi:phosphatidylglycerol---prolipoprotein diacylglyceryl transferase
MKIFEFSLFWITIAPTYYGLMYALAFIIWYYIISKRKILTEAKLDTLVLYIFLWVVLWGRIGYILFYDFSYFWEYPSRIIEVWNGGMSFHGGCLWVIIAVYVFSQTNKESFWKIIDQIASVAPIWIGLGRVGNYINKELLGFVYDGPLAVKVWQVSYFPSPLLEAFLEWLILYIIVRYTYLKQTVSGIVSWVFLIWYAVFRITIEIFVRTPDEKIGYLWWPLTLWALLCIPMFFLWIYVIIRTRKKKYPSKKDWK